MRHIWFSQILTSLSHEYRCFFFGGGGDLCPVFRTVAAGNKKLLKAARSNAKYSFKDR